MKFKEKTIDMSVVDLYVDAMRFKAGIWTIIAGVLSCAFSAPAFSRGAKAPPEVVFATAKSAETKQEVFVPEEIGPVPAPTNQTQRDLSLYWNAIVENPRKFQVVGDLPMLYDFNRRAADIWEKLIECNQGDFARLRQDYARGLFCKGLSFGDSIREDYQKLREDTRGWLSTSEFSSPRDARFGDLGLSNPLKKHSIDIYDSKIGYNTYIKYHVLWVQIVLEIAATNALYSGLDEAEFKALLKLYNESSLINRQRWIEDMKKDSFASPLDYKNEAFRKMYSSNRSLHTTLKLFSYLSPMDCSERGLYPEVAVVVTEGWEPLMDVRFDPEFGQAFSHDQISNSTWMDLACGAPKFLQGLGLKSPGSAKRRAMNRFFSVIRFYRGLDEKFSKADG